MALSKMKSFFFIFCALFLALTVMAFPKTAYEASLSGLEMWWDVVFPSLLPFFIISEILIGLGFVSFLGTMLEPFMRPLFRVPGTGGFVFAMGLASGYPAGAKLTVRLRQERQMSAIEAERLAAFTNFSNPLFMFGAVAVGFFHEPQLGLLLAVSHYLGNICVGFCMRFYGTSSETSQIGKKVSLRTSFERFQQEQSLRAQPFGLLLGEAVRSSISTLLMIGGFIILFSVLNQMLEIVHVNAILARFFAFILHFFGLPPELGNALVAGLFEITNGSQKASEVETALHFKVVVTSFILAFGGFSIQAQVASIFAESDLRFKPFFLARLLHGFFAAGFSILLWKPLYLERTTGALPPAIEAFASGETIGILSESWSWLVENGSLITLFALLLYMSMMIKIPARH